ncbi:MAG: hypothetical protein V3T05_06170 [Myxococcota bacterium]
MYTPAPRLLAAGAVVAVLAAAAAAAARSDSDDRSAETPRGRGVKAAGAKRDPAKSDEQGPADPGAAGTEPTPPKTEPTPPETEPTPSKTEPTPSKTELITPGDDEAGLKKKAPRTGTHPASTKQSPPGPKKKLTQEDEGILNDLDFLLMFEMLRDLDFFSDDA